MWCCKNKIAILVLVVGVLALLFPLSLPASAAVVSVDGWAWQNPLPQGNNIRGVWGDSASDVFAVGDDGTILHYNGSSWNGMTSGTTNDLYGVWGNSATDVFAVGGVGTIRHYDGSSWSSMTSYTTSYLYGVWGSSASNVYAVGASGTVLHYDGSWSKIDVSGLTTDDLYGVWGSSASDVYAVGASGTILHYDGSWSEIDVSGLTTDHLYGVWGSSASNVYAVGASGTVLHYDGSWSEMTSPTGQDLYGVWGSSASNVFVVGASGTILNYGGTNWTSQTSNTSDHLRGVWGSSATDVFAVGDSGTILHTSDGGTNWTSQTSSTTSNHLYGVWGSSDTDVFAVGRDGTILNYDGTDWSSMTNPTPEPEHLNGVWGSSASNVFAVGKLGTVLKYSGTDWSLPMFTPTTADLNGVWGNSATDVFAVGTSGTILHYDGSWSDMTNTSLTTANLNGVWGNSATDVFAVGASGTILHYDGSWSEMTSPTGQDLYSVWGSAGDDVFAVGVSGTICHYDGIWGLTDTGTLSYRGVWGSAGNDVFAVGGSGVISHYNGSSWSSMNSGTGEALYGVWGSSFFDVFAVGGNGTILHYPEQAVISVTPSSGNQGETLLDVTITGIGFTGATVVSFGAKITVTDFTEDSSTQITADITIAADAATGARDVSVTTPGGTPILVGGFTVTGEPTVTGVNPDQGNQGETLDVTITGTNFTAASAVDFGAGITVTDFTEDSSTQITANITIAADAATGARDVSVTTPGGTATLVSGFTVTPAPPTITLVSPGSDLQGETLDVTITGTYLTDASAPSFGAGITVNSFVVDSPTQITANITMAADATTGARDVSVTTPGGTATLPDGFTVTGEPTVTGVNPDQGDQSEALAVTITGTSFTAASAVDFGAGITVNNSFTVVDSTQITANITIAAEATTGARDVSVTTPAGTDTLTDGFTVTLPPPTITAVDPTSGKQGEMLDVVITGTNFTGTEVSFGAGITVNDFDVDGLTQITANITIAADATTGARDVSVTTPGGTDTLEDGFTVTPAPPTITSVNPEQDNQGETLDVTITGTYFTGATEVSFGAGITVNDFDVDGLTQITANITIAADATTGARDVSVTTPGGTDSLTDGFAVLEAGPPPTIASVNPSSGKQGETLDVAITGTNFTGTEVSFGAGITVNDFDVDSSTQITANITISVNATTGARDVSITTPGGTGTLSGGFTVEKKADQDGDGEENGEAGGCGCASVTGHVSANELLIGWAVVGLCWGSGYYLVRRVSRRKK